MVLVVLALDHFLVDDHDRLVVVISRLLIVIVVVVFIILFFIFLFNKFRTTLLLMKGVDFRYLNKVTYIGRNWIGCECISIANQPMKMAGLADDVQCDSDIRLPLLY